MIKAPAYLYQEQLEYLRAVWREQGVALYISVCIHIV